MITVRDFLSNDLQTITRIYEHHTLHGLATFDETPLSMDEMRKRYKKVRAQGLPWLVAVDGDAIAGYAYAMLFHARSGWRFTLEDSVYVAPEAQRQGVGRALLGDLIDRCEALGYRQMIAAIGDSENHGSIGLHAALGFEHAGIYKAVGFKFGRWLDVVLMQRALGEGSRSLPV